MAAEVKYIYPMAARSLEPLEAAVTACNAQIAAGGAEAVLVNIKLLSDMGEVASTIAEEFQPNGLLKDSSYAKEADVSGKPLKAFGVGFKDPDAL